MARPGGKNTPFVYSGTLIVRGEGMAVVRRPGRDPTDQLSFIGYGLADRPRRLRLTQVNPTVAPPWHDAHAIAEEAIRKQPLAAVSLAAAAGFLLAMLVRR